MGDLAEFYAENRKAKRLRNAKQKIENTAVIEESGIPFESSNNGQSLMFREKGKPQVDFYPSTGRWQLVKTNKIINGGAEAFLNWYRRQNI